MDEVIPHRGKVLPNGWLAKRNKPATRPLGTMDPIPGLIPRHAQLEDLQVLGFEILNPDPNVRCVRRNGRTFLEGHLESMVTELRDDAQEALGQGRPSGTARRRKN